MSRDEAIHLVQRLMDGEAADDQEASGIVTALERGLVCPHISDYIFWDFDSELTAEKVVERAMAYEPFAL